MAQFEGYERREAKILATLKEYGISSIDECKDICDKAGIDPYTIVQETQPICFENAKWAYTVGAAIAIKAAKKLLTLPLQSAWDFSPSVFPVPLRKTVRSASDTATLAKCFFPKKQNASASSQVTNHLPLPKAL